MYYSIEQLNYQKNRLLTLKNNISALIVDIDTIIEKTNSSITALTDSCNIDGYSKYSEQLKNVKANLLSKRNSLQYTVIPSIDSEIRNYEYKIIQENRRIEEQRRLEEERLRIEEEKRKAEEMRIKQENETAKVTSSNVKNKNKKSSN